MKKTVCELFAGVGGFRCGLNSIDTIEDTKKKEKWETVWFSQWEPGKKSQWAHDCYVNRFGSSLDLNGEDTTNIDIAKVDKAAIPNHNLLVGGFPCLTGDSLVLTKDGYKYIVDVQVGDEVVSHNGNYEKVLNTFDQGIKEVYSLSGLGFKELKATSNHKFYVSIRHYKQEHNKRLKVLDSPKWLSVSDIMKYNPSDVYFVEPINRHSYLPSSPTLAIFWDNKYIYKPLRKIAKLGLEHVYDIEVANSHSFIVNGVATHNCQDYSVARGLNGEKGINGKKGVLWWSIKDVIETKNPPFILLENVDRLLKSPSKQRGRDFGIILACLNNSGYRVEWRVINAAEYGYQQRRRRTYIFAYKDNTNYSKTMSGKSAYDIMQREGLFAKCFPIEIFEEEKIKSAEVSNNLVDVSDNFQFNFENSGFMKNGIIYTTKTIPIYKNPITLGDILQNNESLLVDEKYYIDKDRLYYTDKNIRHSDETQEELPKECHKTWQYIKGGKKRLRTAASGHEYVYSEGPIAMIDEWNVPARTMLTSEGSFNRSTHIVRDKVTNKIRLLTPIEAERIQGFPDDWTKECLVGGEIVPMPERTRYFCMGNALVTNLIEDIEKELEIIFNNEKT